MIQKDLRRDLFNNLGCPDSSKLEPNLFRVSAMERAEQGRVFSLILPKIGLKRMVKYLYMAKLKKHLPKVIIVSASILIIGLMVPLIIFAIQFFIFLSAKPYCSYYVQEQTKTKNLSDRASTALNDSCLEERGWGS